MENDKGFEIFKKLQKVLVRDKLNFIVADVNLEQAHGVYSFAPDYDIELPRVASNFFSNRIEIWTYIDDDDEFPEKDYYFYLGQVDENTILVLYVPNENNSIVFTVIEKNGELCRCFYDELNALEVYRKIQEPSI